jgi:hypothetical protein
MAFTQDSVNQLVQQAATQAGGSLSYADASNAARNLGIPDTMFQGALSTGLITGAPLATQVANTSGMGAQGIGTNTATVPLTVENLYQQYAGRGSDPGGLQYWTQQFGDSIDPTEAAKFQTAITEARAQGTEPAAQPIYFQQNPDVAAAYQANSYGMTPDQFAATHFQNYGASENRAAPSTGLTQTHNVDSSGTGTTVGASNLVGNLVGAAITGAPLTGIASLGQTANAVTGATTTAPLYQSLTANSTSDEIARAYAQLAAGAGGDTATNQKEAVAYLKKIGVPDSQIESGYRDYRELANLGSKFGVGSDVPAYFNQNPDVAAAYAKDSMGMSPSEFAARHYADYGSKEGRADLKTSGILSGFKYANDSGISEKDMRQVLGDDTFNTYKAGFTDYAKTGIANILADNKLSFDEARTQVKFGRDYGYDAQKLADLTGTKKEVFDAIYKNYDDTTNRIVDSALGAEDVKTDSDRVIKSLALQKQFGFTDEDLAKASDSDVKKIKAALDPVRNFGTDLNKILNNTDSTLADTKKIIDSGRNNSAINKLFGTNLDTLDTKIAEIEDRWRGFEGVEPMHAQRVYDQIGQQREKLGDKYYRGVFGDPKIMAATLAKKGIDTLADIGQKDKFEATPAEKQYFAPDGSRVDDLGDGTFGVIGAEGGYSSVVPKSQVRTQYGRTETVVGPDGESTTSTFVPISSKDVDKDGNYQKLIGKVAIDKDTGKEIADVDGQIAGQNSSGGFKKKWNTLNVAFTKDGVPVVTAASQKTGLGGLVQDLAPIISMALPFVLPGLGSALSGMLPGAGVAASGATAAIAPTLMNQALTQGIISGGLSTLGGGQFEKGFLSGAVSPVINTGISSLLPAGMNPDLAKSITSAGTGAFRGALGGGDFSDILKGGITSGLANYGVNTALGASGLTPQQLNFATGIVAPLLQGQKINPMTAFGTLANVGQQTQGARP